METARQFIVQTPWPVFIAFAVVLVRAWRYARPRVGRVNRLWIAPAIIGAVSLLTVFRIGHGGLSALAWVAAFAVGGTVGWISVHRARIAADHVAGRITLPADWTFPPLLLMFFALKYWVGWRIATQPGIERHLEFALTEIALGALIAGIFAGKAWTLWRKWRGARETSLPAPV